MTQILTRIKRGLFEGTVVQEANKYFAYAYKGTKELAKAGPFFDQDEAEVELGTLIDTEWRKTSGTKAKLVRRL